MWVWCACTDTHVFWWWGRLQTFLQVFVSSIQQRGSSHALWRKPLLTYSECDLMCFAGLKLFDKKQDVIRPFITRAARAACKTGQSETSLLAVNAFQSSRGCIWLAIVERSHQQNLPLTGNSRSAGHRLLGRGHRCLRWLMRLLFVCISDLRAFTAGHP